MTTGETDVPLARAPGLAPPRPRALVCAVCATPAVPGARFCFTCGAPLPAERGRHVTSTAERRVVTVLFGDLTDFTSWAEELDPERVSVVVDRVLAALSRAVADVGGYVDKLTGDGIMAVFGAPTAHEDDPERAVRAAVAMQSAVRRLVTEETGGGRRLGLRVGINTGEVLAGVQAGFTYTVVGDTVNTASRLSDAAAVGSILVGRATAQATTGCATWRALPPLRLKGKREPVPAYELVALRPTVTGRLGLSDEPPVVGRDAELGRLIGRFLDAVDRRVPEVVVLTGDAGVGKTRLATELARFAAELPGARVLSGRCRPYGNGRGPGPLVDWVRTACGVRDARNDETVIARVRRTVARLPLSPGGPNPAAVTEGLLALLGLPGAPAPREVATPGAPRAGDPTLEPVLALVRGFAASGPLLLVADDLHWAGDDLHALVPGLVGSLTGPVLLLLVGRDEPRPSGGPDPWWSDLPHSTLVRLGPLEPPAAERLLRAYLDGVPLDAAASRLLLERAGGNPYFLRELLHLLIDTDQLRRSGEQWVLAAPLPSDVLPAGVHAVLAARIDALEPATRAVLRDAAVLGAAFPGAALEALHPAGPAAVAAGVDRLIERGLLRARRDGFVAFTHALVREVAYASVPKVERARRHAAVAAWGATAAWRAGGASGGDDFVVDHVERALALADEMALPPDDPARAAAGPGAAAALRIAERALARDDRLLAARLLDRAVAWAATTAERDPSAGALVRTATVARAAARTGLHRLDDAAADLAEVLNAPEPEIAARALTVLGNLRRRRGDEHGAIAAFVSALAAASDAGQDRLAGEALRELGLIDYFGGRLRAAEQRFTEALELAERIGDERGTGWALQHLAWSATTRGDYPRAEATLNRAAARFAALDDTEGLSWCAGTEAFVRLLQGRFSATRATVGALLPVAETLGQRWGAAVCLTIDAVAAAELGMLSVAREEATAAEAMLQDLGDTWGLAMAMVAEGLAVRAGGDPAAAAGVLARAVQLAHGGYPVIESFGLVVLGYCHLEAADVPAALETARAAVERLSELGLERHARVGAEVLLAQALRAAGRLEEALVLLERAAQASAEPTLLFPRRQALAHYAGALLEQGRLEEARAALARALTVPAEDVRSRVVTARVHAAVLAASGDRTAALTRLDEALELALTAGQRLEAARTERLRARLAA